MSLFRYLQWRIAAQRFGCRPWELSEDQRALVQEQAMREQRVIAAALAAPEADEVQADPDVVQAAVAAMTPESPQREMLLNDLVRAGLDAKALGEAIAAELRAGLALERIGAAAVIDESEVQAYYARQRARLVLPERRAARHILITINDDYEENSRESARRRMSEVADALAAGAEFTALAQRYSECPSALDGGRMGEVRRGQIYPELEAALFALAPGEVCTVESVLGFHLLRCDAVIPPQPVSFDAAAPSIRRKLEAASRHRVLRAWLAKCGTQPAA